MHAHRSCAGTSQERSAPATLQRAKSYYLDLPFLGPDTGLYRSASNDINVFQGLAHPVEDLSMLKYLLLFTTRSSREESPVFSHKDMHKLYAPQFLQSVAHRQEPAHRSCHVHFQASSPAY